MKRMVSVSSLLVLILFLGARSGCRAAPAGPDCSPATLSELPPRLRNMCAALYQFSSALQQYIDEGPIYQTGTVDRDAIQDISPIYDSGVKRQALKRQDLKRQDLDHVFLRFGRRR